MASVPTEDGSLYSADPVQKHSEENEENEEDEEEEEEEEDFEPDYGDFFGQIPPNMGLTENFSATYLSSGNPCLDFFCQVLPDMSKSMVLDLLQKAWEHDALTALKLVLHLRGVRGSGKSDKKHFYTAACWMYDHHPKTLIANLGKVAQVGYYKDLLEVLLRVLQGPEETDRKIQFQIAHKTKREERKRIKKFKKEIEHEESTVVRSFVRRHSNHVVVQDNTSKLPKKRMSPAERIAAREAGIIKPTAERIAADLEKGKVKQKQASELRKENKIKLTNRATKKIDEDENYKSLFDGVADVFAKQLSSDIDNLKLGKSRNISLAGKWCPSLDYSYDRNTRICEAIARRMFPRSSYPEYVDLTEVQYVYRIRDRLRKAVLVPIRAALELPEIFMSARKWGELPYERVASVAMKRYKDFFEQHDTERFSKFLADVEAGKKKIASGALLPHEILLEAINNNEDQVSELQWRAMLEELKKEGTFSSSLAISDVSGSMTGQPMMVSIALGMLTAELCEEPWKNHVITFSEDPQLHLIEGKTLKERHNSIQEMDWGGNTDFQKVFDLILFKACSNKLAPENMIKRLFVFSDMEFDQASSRPWETDYIVICKKYAEAGYGKPPQIVFWNLRASHSIPVTKEQEGVAMVSGFSKNQLKLFMRDPEEAVNPLAIMQLAISGPVFDELVLVD